MEERTLYDLLRGGAARSDSVMFFSDNLTFLATRRKDGTIETSVREAKVPTLTGAVRKIPIVRGFALMLHGFLTIDLKFLLTVLPIALPLAILWTRMERSDSGAGMVAFPVYVIVAIAVFFILFLSNTRKYHAAEHMVFDAVSKGRNLTVEEVAQANRISESCGSNLAVFALAIYAIGLLILPDIGGGLLFLISYVLGYEVFLVKKNVITVPFYALGSLLQRYALTKRPDGEHLEVAIAAMAAMREHYFEAAQAQAQA